MLNLVLTPALKIGVCAVGELELNVGDSVLDHAIPASTNGATSIGRKNGITASSFGPNSGTRISALATPIRLPSMRSNSAQPVVPLLAVHSAPVNDSGLYPRTSEL